MASRLGPRKGMSCFLYSHLRLVQAARGGVGGTVLSGNQRGGGVGRGMSCFLHSHLRLVQAARGAVVGAVLSGNHGGGGVGRGMSCFLHSHLRLVQAARGAVSGAVLSGNHGGIGVSGLSRVSYGLGLHLAHLPLSGNYAVGSGLPRCFWEASTPVPTRLVVFLSPAAAVAYLTFLLGLVMSVGCVVRFLTLVVEATYGTLLMKSGIMDSSSLSWP